MATLALATTVTSAAAAGAATHAATRTAARPAVAHRAAVSHATKWQSRPLHADRSAPLRSMARAAHKAAASAVHRPVQRIDQASLGGGFAHKTSAKGARPALAGRARLTSTTATTGLNFEGIGYATSGFTVTGTPPDPNGAVGATQFVEWVNSSFQVFDKSTGAVLSAPIAGNTLFSGFGGPCQSTNDGDPLVKYDQLAGRWVMSQFANVRTSSGPYLQCFAVSTSSDVLGSYNRYSYSYGTSLPDYGKLGVWPSAYMFTANMFANAQNFAGVDICSLDRAGMLAGNPAAVINCGFVTSQFGLLPSDLDGSTLPPAGANPIVIGQNFNSWTSDSYASVSTGFDGTPFAIGAFTDVTTPSQLANCYSACVQQPGTSLKLDSLSGRSMYRASYRVINGVPNLLVTDSSEPGTTQFIPQWRRYTVSGNTLTLADNGTIAPTPDSRWMGSAALDRRGDMLFGYTRSSTTTYPSVYVSGRLATDPAGTTGPEQLVVAGSGSVNTGYTRWGDYTSMALDPADDCTFWYTGQYQARSGDNFHWQTRIATFKFAGCDRAVSSVAVTPSSPSLAKGTTQQLTATATYDDNSTQDVTGSATWSSDDSTVATVSSTGLLTAVGVGTTTVHAAAGGQTGDDTVTVTPAELSSIAVTPTSASAPVGDTAQYTATGTYTDGSTADVTSSSTWTTDDSTIATVDTSGLVTATGQGDTEVHAAIGSISGSASFVGLPAVPDHLVVTPADASVAKGLTQQYTATAVYSM